MNTRSQNNGAGAGSVLAVAAEVLVVDDDPSIGEALQRGLHLEGFGVRLAHGGAEALRLVGEARPDVIILDIGMPDLDGLEVVRTLRAEGLDISVCILSARSEVDERVAGLQAGADDYLVKPFALSELIARVEALLRRVPTVAPIPLQVGSLQIDPLRRRVSLSGQELELTRREFDLLHELAKQAGIVLSRQQLLSLVWGHEFDLDGNVVDVFVGYLRRKMECDGQRRLLHTVRGVGFVLREAP